MPQVIRWKALLVGGDKDEAAFDNAPHALRQLLLAAGVAEGDIALLSAHEHDAAKDARFDNLWRAAERLEVGPGDGCLVFVTAHGLELGLVMNTAPRPYALSPALLDRLLAAHCREEPTVVIASGCHSGVFAEKPMLAANRVIYTAARRDRTSFGCNAELEFTFFDYCLLDNLPRSQDWPALASRVRDCVSRRETQRRIKDPSEPRFHIGDWMHGILPPKIPVQKLAALWPMVPADLGQAKAVPFGGKPGSQALVAYKAAQGDKAFAVHLGGGGWAWGARKGNAQEAEEGALAACARYAGAPCLLFAVNDRLVWHDQVQTTLARAE